MKILHLVDCFYTYSGIKRYIMVNSYDIKNDYMVVAIKSSRDLQQNEKNILTVISNFKLTNPIYAFFYLLLFCKKNSIDIIHSHHRYFDLIVWILNKFKRTKNLITVHSIVYGKKIISYKSQNLIAVSESVKKHLENYFGVSPEKIHLIYNHINLETYRPTLASWEISKKYNIDTSKFVVGFFSKISINEKGIDLLLNALKKMNILKKIEFQLLVIGDGEDKGYVSEFCRLHHIDLILLKPQEMIQNFYQVLDCCILPSRVEPLGYVMLESAIMKVPFIGSDIDGISEYIQHQVNGLLFQNENVSDLYNKIIYILQNPEKVNAMVEANYKKITEEFARQSSEKLKALYEHVYEEM